MIEVCDTFVADAAVFWLRADVYFADITELILDYVGVFCPIEFAGNRREGLVFGYDIGVGRIYWYAHDVYNKVREKN